MFPLSSHDPEKIGDFLLLNRLGAGGMGVVYLARRGNRRVALKVLNQALVSDPGARHRLQREAETLGRVTSPFVAKLIDWKVTHDEAWLALSFINGPNLREVITENGPLAGERWKALAAGLAEAVNAFHLQDVVHRDVKPSNIIVAPNGPVIIDFGISQVLDATRLTRTGTVEGSPAWLSPEQLAVEQVGLESDVFSLGSTLFYAATGQSPWGAEEKLTVPVIFSRILANKPDFDLLDASQRELLEPLLRTKPESRPTAQDLVTLLGTCDTTQFSDSEWLDSIEAVLGENDEDLTVTVEVEDRDEAATEPLLVEDNTRENAGDNETRVIDREPSGEDQKETEELNKPQDPGAEEAEKQREQGEELGDQPSANGSTGTRSRRQVHPRVLLAAASIGVALALVAPGWFAVSAIQNAGANVSVPIVLEWLDGDVYGQSGTMAAGILGDFYSVSDTGVSRSACVDRASARVYESGAALPVFEVQHRSGSWAVVGDTTIQSGDRTSSTFGLEGQAACDDAFERLMQSSVTRDVLEANQGSDPCVVLRYREPETEDWLEREERWCVWLEGNPPVGAITVQ